MAENHTHYLNFPIQLLSGFIDAPKECLADIAAYGARGYIRYLFGAEFTPNVQRFELAANQLGITFKSYQKSLDIATNLYRKYSSGSPMTGISVKVLFDFMKGEKTEFDQICLLGFLAAKSIIGKKHFAMSNKLMLLSRMAGQVKRCDSIDDLPAVFEKFNNRCDHWFKDKLIFELEDKWGLKYYSGRGIRGFYISFSASEIDLIRAGEKNKKRVKEKSKQKTKNELLRQVKMEIGIDPEQKPSTKAEVPVPHSPMSGLDHLVKSFEMGGYFLESLSEKHGLSKQEIVNIANEYKETKGKQLCQSSYGECFGDFKRYLSQKAKKRRR